MYHNNIVFVSNPRKDTALLRIVRCGPDVINDLVAEKRKAAVAFGRSNLESLAGADRLMFDSIGREGASVYQRIGNGVTAGIHDVSGNTAMRCTSSDKQGYQRDLDDGIATHAD